MTPVVRVYHEPDYCKQDLETFCKSLENNGFKSKKIVVNEDSDGFASVCYEALNSERAYEGVVDRSRLIMAFHGLKAPLSEMEVGELSSPMVLLTDKKMNNLQNTYSYNKFACVSTNNGDSVNLKEFAREYVAQVLKS